ncbi:jg21987 [Pararge aegeria aegeria]|uniref:Jg21987 protein n=1 Tax=Pararge aegeria aegeria TaxID=348720 RepID=A0A8S4QSS6_9NEOP|nr:jg21987 [Pararge aegeria aegeria]
MKIILHLYLYYLIFNARGSYHHFIDIKNGDCGKGTGIRVGSGDSTGCGSGRLVAAPEYTRAADCIRPTRSTQKYLNCLHEIRKK